MSALDELPSLEKCNRLLFDNEESIDDIEQMQRRSMGIVKEVEQALTDEDLDGEEREVLLKLLMEGREILRDINRLLVRSKIRLLQSRAIVEDRIKLKEEYGL